MPAYSNPAEHVRLLRAVDGVTAAFAAAITLVGLTVASFPLRMGVSTGRRPVVLIAVTGLSQVVLLTWPGTRRYARAAGIRLSLIGIILFGVWWSLCMPADPSRVFLRTLSAIWLCAAVSLWLRHAGLAITAACLALLGALAVLPELPVYAVWGDALTFQYLFPREPPFIGPGGRLRPSQALPMAVPDGSRKALRFETNSLGFRNREEVSRTPEPDRYRVLSLGDSFSNGYGIDQDRFFGPVLQRELQASGHRSEVLNAEVSDPTYGLFYLQQYGIDFAPHLVVYGLCGNDIMQNFMWTTDGSLFRLEPGGMLRPNAGVSGDLSLKWYTAWRDFAYPVRGTAPLVSSDLLSDFGRLRSVEWLRQWFVGSERVRLQRGELTPNLVDRFDESDGRKRFFDSFTNLGFLYRQRLEPAEQMYARFFPVVEVMASTSRAHGAEFVLVIFPSRHQVQAQDWRALVERWNLDEREFDLDQSNHRIMDFCREHAIRCLDLTPAFREAARRQNLYLPYDDHFNERGHAVAAKEAAAYVRRQLRPSW